VLIQLSTSDFFLWEKGLYQIKTQSSVETVFFSALPNGPQVRVKWAFKAFPHRIATKRIIGWTIDFRLSCSPAMSVG
jgi:hypothetical protein